MSPRPTARTARTGFANVVGFDDAPFARAHRGDVPVFGAVYADERLVGVLRSEVRRDGRNATAKLGSALEGSKFREHVQCVLLQGIALGGFNVVDLHALHERLAVPVVVVVRHAPDLRAIERALLRHVPGGARKWALIQQAGPMEACGEVFVQRAGLSLAEAHATVLRHSREGNVPEPLRVAHLIAGGITDGESRGRA
jgi:endonuclease V-like protein UPF0215 family